MHQLKLASAHVDRLDADATLPAKFRRLLQQEDLRGRFAEKKVAIKMHVGGGIGYTTIHPLFVSILVDEVKKAGGRPFLTDGSPSVDAAVARGYTPEVVGARVVGAAGEHDQYFYRRSTEVPGLSEIELCGNIVDADALIVFSHGKGHGNSGFGGALKNIAMGCVTCRSRGAIHSLMASHFEWNEELCTHCNQCVDGCPTGAARFTEENKLWIFDHHCRWCLHCTYSCPSGALTMEAPEGKFVLFQQGMAAVVKEVLACFEPQSVYFITALLNITPLCDCWGFSTPSLVPDIGILAGDNIVAVEQAALDLIKWENLIPGSVPDQMLPLGEQGHLFQRLHGKDPYEQVRQAEAMGLGSPEYELVEVK
jgi:uncharacterized Fe-S center protein